MGAGKRPMRKVRVRSKRLDQVDETKLALALWLMVQPQLRAMAEEQREQDAQPDTDEGDDMREAA